MTEAFFGAGATLASITNFETVVSSPANHLDGGRIPYSGPVATRLMDSYLRRDGKINNQLVFDDATDAERMALNIFLFGGQLTNCAELYITALDEFGFYTPYLAVVDRPYEMQQYIPINETYYRNGLLLPLNWLRIQSVSYSANHTRTTSERLINYSTASGSITDALPAVGGVVPYTIYSAVKTSASNNLVIDPNGSEKINGASTLTLSALNARADFYTDGANWFTV